MEGIDFLSTCVHEILFLFSILGQREEMCWYSSVV